MANTGSLGICREFVNALLFCFPRYAFAYRFLMTSFALLSQQDENFAREIMQLFSVGLNKLNDNGTPVLDGAGDTMLTYTNDDIREYARLWTGFESRRVRGNVEVDRCTSCVRFV